jgi:hypothetical protein
VGCHAIALILLLLIAGGAAVSCIPAVSGSFSFLMLSLLLVSLLLLTSLVLLEFLCCCAFVPDVAGLHALLELRLSNWFFSL